MDESIQQSGPRVDPDHPWLGLHPFTKETRDYFFGRTAEIADIFERVQQNALTILYGQSGWGKTSLLRAGLLPKLRNAGFRPMHILLDFGEQAPPLIEQVREKLAAALSQEHDFASLLEGWKPVRPGRVSGRSLVSNQVGEQIVRFVAQREPGTPLEEIEAVPPLVSLLCERSGKLLSTLEGHTAQNIARHGIPTA